MKNTDIIALSGIMGITTNGLDSKDAYKVVGWKLAIKKAIDSISDSEKKILEEVGITDAQAHNRRLAELSGLDNPTEQEVTELSGLQSKTDRVNNMIRELHNEEQEMGIRPLPYGSWHKLQQENRELKGNRGPVLGGMTEVLMHGILWTDPEEEKEVRHDS